MTVGDINNGLNQDFLNALIVGERSFCSTAIQKQFNLGTSIFDIYEGILKPSLYEIGTLWEYNLISVATEHLASAIVETVMNEIYHNIAFSGKGNKSVVVSCVENEFHQIGIKMISDVFELNGWNTYFLGANTPINELLVFLDIVRPDLLALSFSIYFHLPVLENMIKRVHEEYPDLKILVGGQGFRHGGVETISKYDNVEYLSGLKSVDDYIKRATLPDCL